MCAFDLPYEGESAVILRVPLRFIQVRKTRTRTNTTPHGTEASAAGRSGRACVARVVRAERGGMGERGCARRLGEVRPGGVTPPELLGFCQVLYFRT